MMGLAALANKRARKRAVEMPNIDYFLNIKGYPEEVSNLRNMAKAVKDIAMGDAPHGEIPTGIMISGDPGVGKTTLANAFINATGLPVFQCDELVTVESLSAVYAKAQKNAPSIVFLDDIDKSLPVEDPTEGFSSDEARAALKELLSRLDGASKACGVLTVMTANDYYDVNPALRRHGRTDVHITIGLPNDSDRAEILKHYMSKYGDAFAPIDETAASVAKKTRNLTCAALKTLVNDVWLQAYDMFKDGRPDRNTISNIFHKRVLETIGDGLLKRIVQNEDEYQRICFHEAGHAVVEYVLKHNMSDVCVLQIEGNSAGGWTMPRLTDKENTLWTYEDCLNEMVCAMGGTAAEAVKYGEESRSIGCSDDLSQARALFSEMASCCIIPKYDFSLAVTNHPIYETADPTLCTEDFKGLYMKKLHSILRESFDKAVSILRENIIALDALSDFLHENGMASGETVKEILEKNLKKPAKAV